MEYPDRPYVYLHELTGSSCEEMESNAVAQICTNYGIPFIAIRILSNAAIHNEFFAPEAGDACQKYVLNVAEEYMKQSVDCNLSPNPLYLGKRIFEREVCMIWQEQWQSDCKALSQ